MIKNIKLNINNNIQKIQLLINDNKFFNYYYFVVNQSQLSIRIDKFLINFIQNTTRNKIQNAANLNNILVNGKPVKSSYKIKEKDIILVVLKKSIIPNKLIPENIPLTIIYEDNYLLVINKPSGMVVHPGNGNYTGTLINSLLYYLNHNQKSICELKDNPGLIHRIDKDTSGLLLIAKNKNAMINLSKQFVKRSIERLYIALAWGNFQKDYGIIQENIGRDLKNRIRMSVFIDKSQGKDAITYYRVLERFHYVTLLECKIKTGRTHQIRAHMKYIGHTLFNDEKYGGNKILKGIKSSKYKNFIQNCFKILPRQALHAKTLGFLHPKTGKKIFFNTELPEDMKLVIQKWRSYTAHYSS